MKARTRSRSAFLIAAVSSNSGKTSITMGVIRMLRRMGYVVQPFKCGPDYLDPTFLRLAADRPCYNLDTWMMGEEYVRTLFMQKSADADIAIIEGAMGLFDGATVAGQQGTTGHIAKLLDVSILLTLDLSGMGGTAAAVVHGCVYFDSSLHFAGIIGNRAGSTNHATLISNVLEARGLPPLLGAIPKDAFPVLPSRHLGLVSAKNGGACVDTIDRIADCCAQTIQLESLLPVPGNHDQPPCPTDVSQSSFDVTIAVAKDEAFQFIYPDNIEALISAGANIVYFSPLFDTELPCADAIYLPGGYPEIYIEQLSKNKTVLGAIRAHHEAGKLLYAECGGLMYLGNKIVDAEGIKWPMCGVLPISTRLTNKRKALAYSEVSMVLRNLFGEKGTILKGHRFHYSEIHENRLAEEGWKCAYRVHHPRTGKQFMEGFIKGRTLASYVHLHWASSPEATNRFVKYCRRPQ